MNWLQITTGPETYVAWVTQEKNIPNLVTIISRFFMNVFY